MTKSSLAFVFTLALLNGCTQPGVSRIDGNAEPGERPIQDSRVVGQAVDVQGLVQVRSVNESRWRPIDSRQLLDPGDWIRCDNRGPNAVRIAMPGGRSVILGPGSVVECAESANLKVIAGELEVAPGADSAITVSGGASTRSFTSPAVLRVSEEAMTVLEHEPSWLQGFKGTVVNESMGSLLVKVDGRDVPLTVGYHKVTIDIRDQIARTVIEESFVNHTHSRLEGIFHFPLPADASISEFGMWIGDELVTADVVEKQRAREIYETILRERRDPGLLEWAGGNMFKARVFPIFAHSEKRVTLTYTQVLPMRDGVYRYTYPLQSDMLRQNPLRELQLTATISSAAPLESVECTSHPTRQRSTKHAASLEFTAQNYTPNRDFEIAIAPKPDKTPITVVAHQRGEDGYFLLLVNADSAERGAGSAEKRAGSGEHGMANTQIPKDPNANVQRSTSNAQHSTTNKEPSTKNEEQRTEHEEPLNLVFLADTSGSMDAGQRKNQAEFLRTMLSSLAEGDRFALFACDVDCVPLTDGLVSPDSAESALDTLARRDSLGWTNLDNAFSTVLAAAPAGAHIIYVGDGIPATSDIDPVETAQRLRILLAGSGVRHGAQSAEPGPPNEAPRTKNEAPRTKNQEPSTTNQAPGTKHQAPGTTIHTVATGSAYEAVIMKALASGGGGSFREMRGERAPVTAASELLYELTHPGLRDLSVEFRGIRTACVYPAELPNLAAGMQQIIVGRYLPTRAAGTGKVIVRGTQGDKPVEYIVPIKLLSSEAPGTKHEEPGTKHQAPSTSSGNSFIPRLWARRHLDALLEQGATPAIREQIVGFSQEFKIMTPYTSFLVLESDEDRERFGVKRHFEMRDGEAFFAEGKDAAKYELTRQQMLAAARWRMNVRRQLLLGLKELGREYPVAPAPMPMHGMIGCSVVSGSRWEASPRSSGWGRDNVRDFKTKSEGGMEVFYARDKSDISSLGLDGWNDDGNGGDDGLDMAFGDKDGDALFDREEMAAKEIMSEIAEPSASAAAPSVDYDYRGRQRLSMDAPASSLRLGKKREALKSLQPGGFGGGFVMDELRMVGGAYRPDTGQTFSPDIVNEYWLAQVFPAVPGTGAGDPAKLPESWPADVKGLLTGLLRPARLTMNDESLQFGIDDEYLQPEAAKPSLRAEIRGFWNRTSWLSRQTGTDRNATSMWATTADRGMLDHTYMTARSRACEGGDIPAGFPDLGDGGKNPLAAGPDTATVSIQKAEAGVAIHFRNSAQDFDYMVLVVDPDRAVLLEKRTYNADGLTATEKFDSFAEVAGVWWPTTMMRTNGAGVVLNRRTFSLSVVADRVAKQAFADFANERARAVELPQSLPPPTQARRQVAAGKGGIADYASLICHAVALQKWDVMGEPEKALFALVGERTAKPWMQIDLFVHSRRNEDARQRIEAMAGEFAESAKSAALEYRAALLKPVRQLVNFANSAVEVNERLKLLEILKPVYAAAEVSREWRQTYIGLLQQAGRLDAALAEAETFYADFPEDVDGITTLTSLLGNMGEHARAYALLAEKTGGDSRLKQADRLNLYNHWISLQQNSQSDRQAQADVFERMLNLGEALGQVNEYNYRRYLSVLFSLDPEGIFKERMNQWLDLTAEVEEEALRQANLAKLQAAVNMALGNSYDGLYNVLAPAWIPDLARIVESFAATPQHAPTVNQIMSDHRFQPTDEAAVLRAKFAKELTGDIGGIAVAPLIQRTQWIRFAPPAVEKDQWQIIIANLAGRWEKLPVETPAELAEWLQLGDTIVGLNQAYIDADAAIGFSRRRLAVAKAPHIGSLRLNHFNLLIGGDWRQAYEDEAFALLHGLCKSDGTAGGETVGVHALMLLVDWMVDRRIEAGLREEELAGKLQNMDRKTRWALEKQLEAEARLAALTRLERESGALPGALTPWAEVERLDLQTRILNATILPEKLPETLSARQVVAEVREALGPQAPSQFADAGQTMLLRRRLTLAEFWAAGGRGIEESMREDLGKFLVQYCRAALQQAPKEPEAGNNGLRIPQAEWRQALYDLLVILQQPEALEQHLREWGGETDGDAWRIPLAYLLAATDRINGAIIEMARAESVQLLGPDDYRALSGWYQVVDEKAKHIAARRKALEQMPEHILSNWIYYERDRSRRRDWRPEEGVPPEIDIEAIADHFIVLFRKSQSPASYIWQLRDIYTNTRDFRLLRCVPEGIVGMSAQQVYPMLDQLRSVLSEIRDEAVVDEFYAAIVEMRRKAVSTVDARALLLLEAEIMRRASEVLNQPGQHTPKALAALKAAFDKGDWGPGEELQMARYLANLGRISQEPLAAEQRRQMKLLHEGAEPGTLACLQICMARCQVLWSYSQDDDVIALLEAELTAYRQATGGVLVANANAAMDQLAGYCEARHQFHKAEGLLLAELARPANRSQWRWLRQRIYRTYNGAVRHQGTTSLGTGQEQYQAVCKLLANELLSEKDYGHAQQLVTVQCDIFRSARDAKLEGVADDVVRFAMDYFPEMAVPGQQYIHQYHNSVGQLAETVKDLASPKAGIAFLLAVAAKEPPALAYGYQSFWGQHAYRLGDWRQRTQDLGELEKPLLDLVCRELRRHLETGQTYRQELYHNNNSYFWNEKADAFAAVAEEVLAKFPESGKIAFQVGHYLFEGLDRYDRAIEILAAAYERKLLDENAQSYFAQCLTRQGRHAEAVPVLEHLVAWRPDTLDYRTRLMQAYHGAGRPADTERCRAAADEHFRQPQRWNESVAYGLGSACRTCQLDQHAVVYFEDAIALRRKALNDRIQNDHQISNYYYELAESYSRLGNTRKAVDAASGAIVCWSRDLDQRRHSVSRLTEVLNKAKDLDGFMQDVDAEAEKTGLENPVLRKAAGYAYDNRGQPEKAIMQLTRALEGQPDDVDTHRLHADLLQRLNRADSLPAALLAWHRAAPRDPAVIQRLQQAYENMKLPQQAERAATMLVESQPLEASAHQALAELRQSQDRWEEAVPHWQRVAELRELEPTGLLGLAKARMHLKQTDAAKETVQKLLAQTWPERFGNIHDQARSLLGTIEK